MRRLALCLALLPLPAAAETARPVVSEIIIPGPPQARSFTGTVEAEVTTDLAFLTLGRVATLEVGEGDRVTVGTVLATLDQVTLNEDLSAAKAALQSAQAGAQFAQQSFDRMQELVTRGVASASQLETSQASLDTAQAGVTAAEADLARAQDAAGYSALTAPMDGIVTETLVDPGTVVSAGTPILTLAGLTGREAVLDVPPDVLSLLKLGDSFDVTGRGSLPITGTLVRIEPSAGTGTRSRRIHLALTDPPQSYRLGSLVSARPAGEAASVVTLPQSAITGPAGAPQVWKVGEGRKVGLVPVTLGATLGDRVVVTGGLAEADEIVVRGVNSLSEGQTVGEGIN
ncbi:efflux RND transporter periplasmic adaptor subunit [Frigidibacter mobilis]|uniref:RND family efflux transporter subunit MFP n=1 Tax=Frigidibacter mobilis TaxID=1335048 RepID=A0A165SLH0_9RHOB|nr:efflux RND transporter periplasmic adaptor subunit [Frigidibacter mobilis]AMY69163.1 RND family efflux transporter subunit MFP [Frigidibacter mobilis]